MKNLIVCYYLTGTNEKLLSLHAEGITGKKLESHFFIRDNDVRNGSYIEKLKTFVISLSNG